MASKYDCSKFDPIGLKDVIDGFDPKYMTQQWVYTSMAALYLFTDIIMMIYFFYYVIRKSKLSKKIYLIILYVLTCILFLIKSLFYLGGEKMINYDMKIYWLLSFLPPLMQDASLLIYCLGLEEILIKEQEAEEGDNLGKYKKVKVMTYILLLLYAIFYIGTYVFNMVMQDNNRGDIGKNIYFAYRFLIAIVIACLVMWCSIKVRESLSKFKEMYKAAMARTIVMAGCLSIHCILKIVTSILFMTNILILIKCEGYNNKNNWYYVGYLSIYHFLNEFLPCIITIRFMTSQEKEDPRDQENSSEIMGTNDYGNVDDALKEMDKKAAASKRLKKSLATVENTFDDD